MHQLDRVQPERSLLRGRSVLHFPMHFPMQRVRSCIEGITFE